MPELHFVGYNGYHQFPDNKEEHSKVMTQWASIFVDGNLNACTHRFVLLETEAFFKIYGVLCDSNKVFHELHKPARTGAFGSCDGFLIAAEGTNIWKCAYKNMNWTKVEYSFTCSEERAVWEERGNKVSKFSFQENSTNVILLLSNGSVWSLDRNNCLMLLYPYDMDRAIDISSGLDHSLILTESGCVLSFGSGSRGQLGHGNLDPTPQPVQVEALEGLKVTRIATGGWHSCAVTDSGDLYTWGWNESGQLSAFENGKEIGGTALPVVVDVEDSGIRVLDVSCGRRHTVALLENGDLYSAGWNKYAQLGIETPREKASKFTKCAVKRGQNMRVLCGPWYTILTENLPE